jgi:ribosomal protein S12 methylthiotransferase accessory factor
MRDGRDQSGGKGSSAAQAQASALCEALERFSAVFRGGEVDACGPMRVVEGAIDPSDVMLFSDRQYASRGEWNAQLEGRFHEVPQPFDAADEVSWSRVWWLQSGEAAHVPTSLLYYGFRGPGSQYCNADSNGLAAGQTLEEAVLQGFFELVERDAVALWWYNRIAYPQVDVASFEDRYIDRVFSHYRQIGRECWVLDLTSDIEIPVFAALSARVGSGRPEVIFGFGADLDASIALRRCVTEMNQMLATVRRPLPERRAQLRGEFGDALRWWLQATLEDNAYILPSPALGSRSREYFLHDRSDDLLDDVQRCMAIADHHGLRVYVRDMTRADLGIAVVKMIVPGLRHFWRRLGPGRLYDVPVKLGKRSIPVAEPDMNPTSMFA